MRISTFGRRDRWHDRFSVSCQRGDSQSRAKLAAAAAVLSRGRRRHGLSRVSQSRSRDAPPAHSRRPRRGSAPTDAASALGAEAPAIDLPPLNESDEVVRGLVKELSSNPSVAAWLDHRQPDSQLHGRRLEYCGGRAGRRPRPGSETARSRFRSKSEARICSSIPAATRDTCPGDRRVLRRA